jgi:hypothetical protein
MDLDMRILGKDSYWWKSEEKEWAMQDRDGDWYVYRKDKTPTMKTSKKRKEERGAKFTKEQCVIIGLAAAFGVSLAALIAVLIS